MAHVTFTVKLPVQDSTPALAVDNLGEDLRAHASQFIGKNGPASVAWTLDSVDGITEMEERTLESDLKEGRY